MWGGIPIPYIFPLLKISFTPIKGDHGPLCILAIPVTVVQPGRSTGAKARERSDREGGGCGRGFSPPTVGRFFWKFVYENDISCTLNGIIRGLVMWSDIYQSPTPPFFWKIILLHSRGAGAWPLVPLAMPVTVVQPGFVNGRPKRGSEATERGRVWEGVSPSHGREIFPNLCLKTAFSCTLDTFM